MRVALIAVAAILLAGCTTVTEETPQAPSPMSLPPRPREVRLDGVDPCSLLTGKQRTALGLSSMPSLTSSYAEIFEGEVPTCTIHSSDPNSIIIGVGTVTTAGIERWQDPALSAQIRPIIVTGFPALVVVPKLSRSYCGVEIDIARGQLLGVQALDGGNVPSIDQERLCSWADHAANETVRSLLTR
jgi:hypothetical protein